MLEIFHVVGDLAKARTAGSRNANHKSVAILHVGNPSKPRYVRTSDLAKLPDMMRRYARRGIPVRLEPLPGHKVEDILHTAHQAEKPRAATPTKLEPAPKPAPMLLGSPKKDQGPQLTDPLREIDVRGVLAARLANYTKRSRLAQAGKTKGADIRTHEILKELESLHESVAGEDDPNKKDSLKQKISDLQVELSQRPMGPRQAEAYRIKKLMKQRVKESGKEWLDGREADRLRFRLNRLFGHWIPKKVAGSGPLTEDGRFVRVSGLNQAIKVNPTEDPMGYMLSDGWPTQAKVKRTTEDGNLVEVDRNAFRENEQQALLDQYREMGRRILYGKVWKNSAKGLLTMFPHLDRTEFKAELDSVITSTILEVAEKYTPDFATLKLGQGISFPRYLNATLEGVLKTAINQKREELGGTAAPDVELNDEIHAADDSHLLPEMVQGVQKKYVSPEEHALVADAMGILRDMLQPEEAVALFSYLNLHNSDDHPHGEPPGAKSASQVADDMVAEFGQSKRYWESRVKGLWEGAISGIRDLKRGFFNKEEREATVAAFKIIASAIGGHRATIQSESWKRELGSDGKEISKPSKRNQNMSRPITEDEDVRGGDVSGVLGTRSYGTYEHVRFWDQDKIKPLARLLAVHPFSLTDHVITHPVTGKTTTTVVHHPADLRYYVGLPNVSLPGMLDLQNRRMKTLHDAYEKLSKLPAAKMLADLGPAVEKLNEKLKSGLGQRHLTATIAGKKIKGLSPNDLRTMVEWLAKPAKTKKSLTEDDSYESAAATLISQWEGWMEAHRVATHAS